MGGNLERGTFLHPVNWSVFFGGGGRGGGVLKDFPLINQVNGYRRGQVPVYMAPALILLQVR